MLMGAVMLLASASAAGATTVKMTDKQVSIDVPDGWSYARNVTRGGVTHDLEIKGPADSSGNRPIADLDSGDWKNSSVSPSDMNHEMEREIETEDGQHNHSVEIIQAPKNETINGEHANEMTLKLTSGGVVEREKVVLVVSTKLHTSYTFRVTDLDTHYDAHSSDIQSMISSIKTIPTKSGTLSSGAVTGLVIGVIAVAAIVGVGAAIILRRKTPR